MQENGFEFVRLVGEERRVGEKLADVSRHWQGDKECFIFFSPHDDDVVMGGGLLIQLAHRENIPVYLVVVTDGSMGYCSMEEKDSISEIRRKETYECYRRLGIPDERIIWLGYPDCQLTIYRGRRPAQAGDPEPIGGYVGLQNAFTHYLRKVQPTQIFMPTINDLHPDHRIVYEEALISVFHSVGAIWPEMGEPLGKAPYIHEMAVYCDFPKPPTLRMRTPQEYLDNKVNAIQAFKSQKQIEILVDNVRKAGAQEYVRAVDFKLYHPGYYFDMFEHRPRLETMH